MTLTKVEGSGEASLFRGDPRVKMGDIDSWYKEVLTFNGPIVKRPYLYGSDAGHCPRRNVLLEKNEWIPGHQSAVTQAYMNIGIGLEDMLAKALHAKGRLIVQGQRLVEMPTLKISGKMDLLVFDHEDKLALIEVKTCGKLPHEGKVTHLAQVETYAAVSGIDNVYLTYISRGVEENWGEGLAIRTFQVDCSEAALEKRLMVASLSALASQRGKLPPVPASFRKHTECHFCEFRDHFCWTARPGLLASGSLLSQDPLPELSPSEYLEIQGTATDVVGRLMEKRGERFQRTLSSLLSLNLSPSQREKLQALSG